MAANPNPALETWPYASFGNPQRDPDIGVIDPVVRTDMDFGQKSRERYINPILQGSYRVRLTNEQYQYFQAWHKHKISNGSDWFNFKVRVGSVLSWEEVKMVAMYQPAPESNRYVVVQFTVIQRTDSIPSEATLDSWLT